LPDAQQHKPSLGGRQAQLGHGKMSGCVGVDALGLVYSDSLGNRIFSGWAGDNIFTGEPAAG